MKVCSLAKGSVGCKGSVVSVEKDMQQLINILLVATNFSVFVARKWTDPKNSNACNNFKARRQIMWTWLTFLTQHDKLSRNVIVDKHNSITLPEIYQRGMICNH